jgi:hypothetical protein
LSRDKADRFNTGLIFRCRLKARTLVNWTGLDHLNARQVQYSNVHCNKNLTFVSKIISLLSVKLFTFVTDDADAFSDFDYKPNQDDLLAASEAYGTRLVLCFFELLFTN